MNNNFYQPQRQSYWAIVLIIFKLYKVWIKSLMPILIGLFVGSKNTTTIFIAIGFFSIIVGIFGLISFFKYTFYLSDNELVINKGVFKRSKIIIPFERIQSINFKQTILHQIFSVVELEIDTAGSAGKEFDLRAIAQVQAESLREIILAGKPEEQMVDDGAELTVIAPINSETPAQVLFKLSILDLFKVGLTQNHFRSGLIPIALYFWLQDLLRQGGVDLHQYTEEYADPERLFNAGLFIVGIFVFGYAFFALLISLILSIFRFFNLVFFREVDGFKVSYGLFTKRQISIKDAKIQIFEWQDNLLRKIPKIFNLQIKQAASATVKQKTSSIHLAGVSQNHISQFLNAYFPKGDYRVDDFTSISKWWLIRQATILGIIFVITMIITYFEPNTPVVIGLSLLYMFILFRSYLFSNKSKIGVNDEVIHVKSGHFGDVHELIQLHKIQGAELQQSPFQRRKKLASLILFTAAGNIKVPYIPIATAKIYRDYIIHIVETDGRAWM